MTRDDESARWRAIVESASDAIVTLDTRGVVLTYNAAAEKLFGYRAADIIGSEAPLPWIEEHEFRDAAEELTRSLGERVSPDHSVFQAMPRRGMTMAREWVCIRANGEPLLVHVATSALRGDNDEFLGVVNVARDMRPLRASNRQQELLAELVATSEDALITTDAEGMITSWNDGAYMLFGYTAAEMLGHPVTRLVGDDMAAALRESFAEIIQTGEVQRVETVLLHRSGKHIDVAARYSAVVDAGAIAGVSIHLRDISARVQAARERLEAIETARQYERLFETSNSMAAITGFDGHFKQLNPAWERALGFTRQQLCERPFVDFVHPEDIDSTSAAASWLAEAPGEVVNFVNRYRCSDGSYRWLSWNAVSDPEFAQMYAVAHDITELVEIRERLSNSEQLLQETARMASLGGWELVLATGELRWSEEVYRIHELPIGRKPSVDEAINFYAPEDRPMIREAVERAVADGIPYDLELGFITATGRRLWVRAKGEAVEEDGERTRLRGTFQDITRQREIDRLKSEFVSMVSHELRTPLTSIHGSLRLLTGGVAGELPATADELVNVASTNCERLIHLINDILDLEKIEAGKLELNRRNTAVAELIERACAVVTGVATTAGVSIKTEIVQELHVHGDPDRLVQVLTNLLSNAIKFSPRGSEIVVRGQLVANTRARLSVTDEGPGISEADRERLFKRFQQLDSSDTRKVGGSGLGLSICKGLIDRHGGEIGVESRPGAGSTFWFELPNAVSLEPAPTQALPGSRHSVLVVEDDSVIAHLLRLFLRKEGYEVTIATTLSAARDHLEESRPDAVLLDLRLPDGNGMDLLEHIRTGSIDPELPVIILSGSEGDQGQFAAEIVDWLVKPFDEQQLRCALRRAVRRDGDVTALVVEDNPGVRRLIELELESIGVRSVLAKDGHEAIRLAHKVEPDLIILDVGLPGRDGFDVIDVLRNERSRSTPLIVYTGRDLSHGERDALQLGLTRHLTKAQSTRDQFIGTVRELLSGLLEQPQPAD